MPHCQAVRQNHPNQASREMRGRNRYISGPANGCPRGAGTLKTKAHHKRGGDTDKPGPAEGSPRESGTQRNQKLSERNQERKARAHKGWVGTQRSRDARTKKAVREKPVQKSKNYKRAGERHRVAGTLKEQKAVPGKPGQKSKSTEGMGTDPEKLEP